MVFFIGHCQTQFIGAVVLLGAAPLLKMRLHGEPPTDTALGGVVLMMVLRWQSLCADGRNTKAASLTAINP
jgi:hypothetical protein